MPSKIFENLNENKKKRILQAAIEEFSKRPLMKSTSSSVIRNAEISRGSFYQYFDNIRCVYSYMLRELWLDYRGQLINSLSKQHGNLYNGLMDFAGLYLQDVFESEYTDLFKNLFLHYTYVMYQDKPSQDEPYQIFDEFRSDVPPEENDVLDVINIGELKLDDSEEIISLIHYLIITLHESIVQGMLNHYDREAVLKLYQKRLDWIYFGVKKS